MSSHFTGAVIQWNQLDWKGESNQRLEGPAPRCQYSGDSRARYFLLWLQSIQPGKCIPRSLPLSRDRQYGICWAPGNNLAMNERTNGRTNVVGDLDNKYSQALFLGWTNGDQPTHASSLFLLLPPLPRFWPQHFDFRYFCHQRPLF